MICIYCIECVDNDRKYIGATRDYDKRINFHFGKLKSGKHSEVLQEDYLKYGRLSFIHYIIEELEDNEQLILERENYWMNYYKTYIPKYGIKFGYNLQKAMLPNKTQNRVNSIKNSGKNNGMYGKKHSDEMRKKISENAKKAIPKKLTIEECIEIRKKLAEYTGESWGKKYKRISMDYNCSDSTIRRIKEGTHSYSNEIGGAL